MKKTALVALVFLALFLVAAGCTNIPPEIQSGLLPKISLFEAVPSTINEGEVAHLRWSVLNADSTSIDNGIGNVALQGTMPVLPSASLYYTLTAKNFAGEITARTQVFVESKGTSQPGSAILTPPTIVAFNSEYAFISPGQSVKISWKVEGATDVRLDPFGQVNAQDTITINPTSTMTYVLTATNAVGKSTAGLTIVVQPSLPSATPSQAEIVLDALSGESGSLVKVTGGYLTYNKYQNACAGDTAMNLASRAFLSFDISFIPDNAIIQEAVLDLGDYTKIGDPSYTRSMWGNMGKLEIYSLQYGRFEDLGFSAYNERAKLVEEVAFDIYPLPELTFDVTYSDDGQPIIQDLVRAEKPRCQFRIQFFTSTNWDGASDMLCFDNASLTIKYITK